MTRSKSKAVAPIADAVTTKLFVLDTNVLLHDPSSLFHFKEHDVFLPMIVLEELDGNKKGLTEVARNARQTSRDIDSISAKGSESMSVGFNLNGTGRTEASGKLFFQSDLPDVKLPAGLPDGKADNNILGVVEALRVKYPGREVVLVSNDINMRIKARALNLPVEDYKSDKLISDIDILPSGKLQLPANFWEISSNAGWDASKKQSFSFEGPLCDKMHINQFLYLEEEGEQNFYAVVREVEPHRATIEPLVNYCHRKKSVYGICARNREQNFALNLLMDPRYDFITLTGVAGTGKTLLTLAAAIEQVVGLKTYSEIIMTRATVSTGDDIGFLPGTEQDKMGPWMGALEDNLEVLLKCDDDTKDWSRAAGGEEVRSRIKIKSMNFMRGRTFLSKYVIIDEAQNLTPKQMKTLITRAGPGTKIVCLGNLAQIDTPYLTEASSGLTYAIERFRDWEHGGHILLERGERSRLADYANDAL